MILASRAEEIPIFISGLCFKEKAATVFAQIFYSSKTHIFVLYQMKYLPRDAIIHADKPASDWALEVSGATTGQGWWSLWDRC